jgi:hypothetical protein
MNDIPINLDNFTVATNDPHETRHGRMARGDYGFLKVPQGTAMADPSKPCGRVSPKTAVSGVAWPFQGWPAHRAGGLRQSSTLFHPTPTMKRVFMHIGQICGDEWTTL